LFVFCGVISDALGHTGLVNYDFLEHTRPDELAMKEEIEVVPRALW